MNIIYHYPLPLNPESKSASGIRPVRLLEEFKKLGCTVYIIDGYSCERKKKIKEMIRLIQDGIKFDVCYSESSTMPTALTDRNHLPFHPFMDYSLFRCCKKFGIPVKLFYRDIYWKFPDYYKHVKFPFSFIAYLFYKYDLLMYKKYVDTLFIPSMQMKKYVPEINRKVKVMALPSGVGDFLPETSINKYKSTSTFSIFYVGGIGNHYDFRLFCEVIKKYNNFSLTLCVRPDDWDKVKETYPVSDNINIIHVSGQELTDLYLQADLLLLFVKPSVYWEFAVPFKLFEYMSADRPIIASKGTFVGEFVEKNDIGWTIDYTEEALSTLLNYILKHPDEIAKKKSNIKVVAEKNTWKQRCLTILDKTDSILSNKAQLR